MERESLALNRWSLQEHEAFADKLWLMKSSHQPTVTSRSLLLSSLRVPLSHNHPLPGSEGSLITSDVKDKSVDNSSLTRSLKLSQPASKVCFVNLPSRQNKSLSHSCGVFFYLP